MATSRPSPRLSDYTSIPVEIIVASFSVLPIFLLIYFYPILPERIPVFLNLSGEVEVWATKSVASVFRLPAMALDLQAICLLMKYGAVRYQTTLPAENTESYQRRSAALSARLWDWLRCFNGVKMSAESLSILFMSDGRLHFLRTPAWAVAWIAAILGVAGALFYCYRLLIIKREMKEAVSKAYAVRRAPKHVFSFDKRTYALAACLIAYTLLVFWPL